MKKLLGINLSIALIKTDQDIIKKYVTYRSLKLYEKNKL